MSMVPHLMKSLSILRLSVLAYLITLAGSLGAEPIPAEYRIGGAEGEERWMLARGACVRDASGLVSW
jgi:hypothetical protein